jgi:hypothetical protein
MTRALRVLVRSYKREGTDRSLVGCISQTGRATFPTEHSFDFGAQRLLPGELLQMHQACRVGDMGSSEQFPYRQDSL